ncbi:hypothetical protein [Enterococcus sp. DIV1420a]|uniref:hypothetical protein n=1 Tax=Enterococcus sp. DIV1420a TaxID=2774672 RepID=UPI0010EFCB0D|nr:hypothetical protein [Listeria monocytogenes]EAK8385919.1 hypothetical protein [Listeria monocytogenes]
MKVFKWSVETIICKDDFSLEVYAFQIETIKKSLDDVFLLARYKTQAYLKEKHQKYHRIGICWFELESVDNKSDYQRFIFFHESKRPRKAIMNILQIPFWKLKEYEDYYNGKTKRLTPEKYRQLRKFLTNEKIRIRYKIPECEFQKFLEDLILT